MSYYPGIDMNRFKGFAIVNRSDKPIAIKVVNESSFPKEFILEPKQVFYAKVADVAEIMDLEWAEKSGFKRLEVVKK